MKITLTLLAASTALTAALGVPAWSAIQAAPADGVLRPVAALFDAAAQDLPLVLASDDDDDHDHGREGSRRGHDDDDHDDDDDDDDHDDDDDDCDDDGDGCRGGARNPAPAGTVAPPQNGLFGNGAAPRVQVN